MKFQMPSARWLAASLFLALPVLAGAAPQYAVVHGWPQSSEGDAFGAVAGLGVDSAGNVFVFHRSGRTWPTDDRLALRPIAKPTVTVLDAKTGAVLSRWGAGRFAMPHGLTIDDHDNVWLTDVSLQQVYKFSHSGELLLTLGERGVPGNDRHHFNRPTAVAVAPDGSFYVADGYRNSRIVKFSPEGKFLLQWGTRGTKPGQFHVPHGIALDAAGHVLVADRENSRVQVFDGQGAFLAQWSGPLLGRPYAVALDHAGQVYSADGGDQPAAPPDRSAWVLLQADGTPIARFGQWGRADGEFQMAHSIAVDAAGAVYVGDITGGRVQKFIPTMDPNPKYSGPAAVIQENVDAYNAHDVDRFVATFAPEADLFEHPDKLLAHGQEAIRQRYAARLADPIVHATIRNRIVVGDYVVDHELVRLNLPEGPGTMEAIVTSEVKDGRIARAWLHFGPKKLDSEK